MTVIDLKTRPIAHWRQTIINHYPFLPYWWIRGITSESYQSLMKQELDSVLTTEKTCLLGYVSDKGDLLGFAQMRWLEWDTNHFGVEIWRLDHVGTWDSPSRRWAITEALVQGGIQATREQGCKSIQAKIPIDNLPAIHALEDVGFRTMEVLTTWLFDFAKSSVPPQKHPDWIRDFRSADSESLTELVRTVYAPTPNRFHADRHLSVQTSNELYIEWVRSACSGKLADHIAVAEINGEVIGYVAARFLSGRDGLCNDRIAQMSLGAVSPNFRGRGLYTDLIIHNLEWLNRHQADFCLGGTQGNNIPPQRVLLKAGFKPATMALTLHYWADDSTGLFAIDRPTDLKASPHWLMRSY